MRTGQEYGPNQTGNRRFIQWANEEAKDGDVIQISPGALYNGTTSGRNIYLENNVLAIDKSLTFTRIPGQARWTLAPADVPYLPNHSGIVIYEPKQCRDSAGVLGARKKIVIEGFDFSNWGINSGDYGVRIRSNGGAKAWDGSHASITLRDFRLGKLPNFRSASGIAGAAENLMIESGYVYDCGGGVNSIPGNDHNLYINGRKVTLKRVRSLRTRGGMDGHLLKIRGVHMLIEDCGFYAGPEADNSALIQFYGGGNAVVRRSKLEQTANPSNRNGMIWYDHEVKQTPWFFGEAGHSLIVEDNEFLSHHPQPVVFIRRAADGSSLVPLETVSIRRNAARIISLPVNQWINAPTPMNWRTHNRVLDEGGIAPLPIPVRKPTPKPTRAQKPVVFPSWRRAMTEVGSVYAVGDLPKVLNAKQVWPAGKPPESLFGGWSGHSNTSIQVHFGYGGSVFARDMGKFGTMIFGSTGEQQFNNQLSAFTLSDDAPTWDILQQPRFALTREEMDAIGADLYYNPTEAASLFQFKEADRTLGDRWAAVGDAFPVAYKGWVIPKKVRLWTTGHKAPHAFRYNMPVYLPAAVAGNNSGAIVINSRSFHGPFRGGPDPDFVSPKSRFFADCWPDATRKLYLHVLDLDTKQWIVVAQPIPPHTGHAQLIQPFGFSDPATKRAYYTSHLGSSFALYHVDFSSGIEGAAISDPYVLSLSAVGASGMTSASNGVSLTAPSGRFLYYTRNAATDGSLLMIDAANKRIYVLKLPGMPVESMWMGFGYDAENNRVIITVRGQTQVRCFHFEVPADPTIASNYKVEQTVLTLTEPLEAVHCWQYGQRNEYVPQLGVVLITQRYGPMLAYRPY